MTTEAFPAATATLPTGDAPARPQPELRRAPRRPVSSLLKHAGLIIISLLMLYPLIWMLVSSFKPDDLIFRDLSLVPSQTTLENYTNGWTALRFPFNHYLWNSAILVLGAVIGNLVSCSLAAYAFARLRFRGRTIFFTIMLLTIMLPIHVVIVPQYIMFSRLGMVNTLLPLLIPKFLATDAFFVFLMVQFIRGIPKELDEAARIDGAGHGRIFFQVILPLMVPALATTAIFTFIWTWNDFFTQLIYLTSPENYTVSLALRSFLDPQSGSNFGGMFAMSMISLAPLFLVFLFGQRYLLKGIATTGIK